MLFNTYANGDPRSFMYYKGDYYINKTEIVLTDEYVNNHKFNGKRLWKYARFDHQITYGNQIAYFFCITNIDWLSLYKMGLEASAADDYAPYFVITALELDGAIQEVTRAIKLPQEDTDAINDTLMEMIEHPKSDWNYPKLRLFWIVYIGAMIGSLIFNEFYIIWIVITAIFFNFRKGVRRR